MTDQPIQSSPFPDEGPDLHIGSNGPACPHCGSTTSAVKDSRPYRALRQMTRRRRECFTCRQRFTTYESTVAVVTLSPMVRRMLEQLKFQVDRLLTEVADEGELP